MSLGITIIRDKKGRIRKFDMNWRIVAVVLLFISSISSGLAALIGNFVLVTPLLFGQPIMNRIKKHTKNVMPISNQKRTKL